MKKIVAAALAAAASWCVPALAAPPPAPMFNWTGFYIGGHAGYGWSDDRIVDVPGGFFTNNVPNSPFDLNSHGALGGAQFGYNWQSGAVVFGLEGTASFGTIKDTIVSPYFSSDQAKSSIENLFTAVARLGFVWDRYLVYAKGGFAWSKIEVQLLNPGTVFIKSNQRNGWTIGGGIEAALWAPNWIFGIEYNFYDFGTDQYIGLRTNGPIQHFSADNSVQSVLARVSYRFGGR